MIGANIRWIAAWGMVRAVRPVAVTLLLLLLMLSTGCVRPEKPRAVGSASEFGYSIETAEERAAVIRRFEDVLTLLQNSGVETHWVHNRDQRHEFTFEGKGLDGRIGLILPDNGLANITLVYNVTPEPAAGGRHATQVLAQVETVLSSAHGKRTARSD
jgi:hypothetical protein